MPCDRYADLLPGVADGSAALDRAARAHIETCLRCQAELVQYRKLIRNLGTLRSEWADAPGLLGEILAVIEGGLLPPSTARSGGRRTAYLGGIAAATAAGAGAALVLATRARHRRPLAG